MSGTRTEMEFRRGPADAMAVVHTALAVALGAGMLWLAGCGPQAGKGATGSVDAETHSAGGAAACADTHDGAADPCAAAKTATTDADAHAGHAHEAKAEADADAHAGHAHEAKAEADADAHAGHAHAELTPEAIAANRCEHDVPIADCDECRYEAGLVKLRPDTADALLKTTTVAAGTLVRKLRLTGEVAFDATALVEVLPTAPGTVVSVSARLGQKVSAGDVLAVIHSSEVGEAKAAYLEALTTAEISAQERDQQRSINAALTRLLASLPAGALSAAATSEPLGDWKGKLMGAAARHEQAKLVCDRETALVLKSASSKAELETAQRELQTAEADYAALTEEAQMSLKLELLRAENAARQAEARLAAAQQRLHFYGLNEPALGRIEAMRENGGFADLAVTAPRAGTITALSVTQGRFLDSAQSLCTIADLTNLWVWCDLYERDLGALHAALREQGKAAATVRVAAFADTFRGEVDLLGHEVNEATRTVKVRVQVPDHDGKLRPGMFATVEVELPSGRTVTLAPREAVLADEGRQFVFRHWRDDLWLQRQVVVGESDGTTVEILSGLEPGAEVVVSGGFMLKSDVLREKMGAGCAD